MPQDVAELVAAAQDGDREAFDELVRVTYAESYNLALRVTGTEVDARDVVQDAYFRAFRGLKRFRGDAQFSTWMYRITANCAATHLGKRSKHRHEDLDDTDQVADERPAADPSAQADATALRERLTVALETLPPKLRQVVVLRDIYDLPHEAIAAELGISETAAKVRLHRARKKLREDLFPRRAEEAADAV
jgi:RNA polymerase sigma-70 factor (ECF subfamily)